jgi:cyanophycin synthetase
MPEYPFVQAACLAGDAATLPQTAQPSDGQLLQKLTQLESKLKQQLPQALNRLLAPTAGAPSAHGQWAQALAGITLELQTALGLKVGFYQVRPSATPGTLRVAVEFQHEALGRACLQAACDLCLAMLLGQAFDLSAAIARLKALAADQLPGASTTALVAAAARRGIPALRLSGDVVQLGHGLHARRIRGAMTDRTSAIAETIARDRELTASLLRSAGLPVLEGAEHEGAGSASQNGCEGAALVSAHALVVGRKVVAAATRNGSPQELPQPLHPRWAQIAVDAARVVGLDIAEVELAAPNLSAWQPQSPGGIVAVQAAPDLGAWGAADSAPCQAAAAAIVESLFPSGKTGRIPIVAVTGVNGKTTTTRLIAHILSLAGRCVGMTCTDGIYIAGRRIDDGDCSGPQSARHVLMNPLVDAAVLETARGGILRAGLGFDLCDVAVVTNIGEGDHLGMSEIETPEELAAVKRTVVENVSPGGAAVLKADDPLVAAMAPHCPGSVVFFCRDAHHPTLERRRAEGGRVAFIKDHALSLADGNSEFTLLALDRVPLTHGGRVGFQIENVLAAAAACWALGIPAQTIRAGLEAFTGSVDQVPARFNLLDVDGATLVVDYGHNAGSLLAVIETLQQIPNARRTAVYSTAGDRRNCDMVRQGEILGDAFDELILFEDNYLRGRAPGEIMALFRQGVLRGRRVRQVQEIFGWQAAVEAALKDLRQGDLVLIQADSVHETVDYLQRRFLATGHVREIDFQQALERQIRQADAHETRQPVGLVVA